MNARRPRSQDEISPLAIWFQRFLTVILFLLCGLGLAADRLFPERIEALRIGATDLLMPLVVFASKPVQWSQEGIRGFQAYVQATELAIKSDSLASELDFLRLELARRDALISNLRANVNLPPDGLETYVTARVFGQGSNLFTTSLILNVGKDDGRDLTAATGGIRPGLAVITRKGLLGRLQSVGDNASRVRLLTSQDSALPVLVGEFRIRATVFGQNSPLLTLTTEEGLPGTIRVGDRVTTSTIDPDFPFLFYVGQVAQVVPEIRVLPAALDSPGLNEFVQVVLTEPLDQQLEGLETAGTASP